MTLYRHIHVPGQQILVLFNFVINNILDVTKGKCFQKLTSHNNNKYNPQKSICKQIQI